MRPRLLVLASLCALSSPRLARADTPGKDEAERRVAPWMVLTTELSLGATATCASHTKAHQDLCIGVGVVGMLGLTVGVGLAADAWSLDPRVPQAIHGAASVGAELFLMGTLIDGRDQAFGVRAGTAAYVLGAAGVLGGAVLGVRAHGAIPEYVTLGAPLAGLVVGGILVGLPLALVTNDSNQADGRMATGAVVVGAFGVGAAVYLVTHQDEDHAPAVGARVTPMIDVAAGRVGMTLSGRF
jgi:hypothetical protein